MSKKLILCILDGFGCGKQNDFNAIANAKTPNLQKIYEKYPNCTLNASEEFVGLPKGQIGNSEVGHFTIGSGRVIMQDLPRIDKAFSSNEVEKDAELIKILSYAKTNNKQVHLVGLVSHGGVHSHINHYIAMNKILENNHVNCVNHLILDGRDTAPIVALEDLKELRQAGIKPATLSGRFYAMDRDERFARTKFAYDAIVEAKGELLTDDYINLKYAQGVTDEFINPAVSPNYKGVNHGDVLIFTNFRSDRARQICSALIDEEFNGFEVKKHLFAKSIIFSPYSKRLSQIAHVLFPKQGVENTLGEVIANENLTQLRIAETEKYAHVTYFFNGGIEIPYKNEERVMLSSQKVETYDLTPKMSAIEIMYALFSKLRNKQYDFVCMNLANPDMVGHTGNYSATVDAIECIDECLGKLHEFALQNHYQLIITADHGNAEEMFHEDLKQPHTSHTLNPVPFIYIGDLHISLKNGTLSDVAPTILKLMNINIPKEMTGNVLFNV